MKQFDIVLRNKIGKVKNDMRTIESEIRLIEDTYPDGRQFGYVIVGK